MPIWHSEQGIPFNRMRRSLDFDYDSSRQQTGRETEIAGLSRRVLARRLLPDSLDRYSRLFLPCLAGLFRGGKPADRADSTDTHAAPHEAGSSRSRVSESRRPFHIWTVADFLLLAGNVHEL